jgi:hypothetical protein
MNLSFMKMPLARGALRRFAPALLALGLAGGLLGSGTFGLPESYTWHKRPKPVCTPACASRSKCILQACAYTGTCPPTTLGFCARKCQSNQDCLKPDGTASGQFCNCESGGDDCRVVDSRAHPNIPVNVCFDPAAD